MTYTTVITASELEQHIARPDWIVFDCRFNLADPQAGQNAYQAGHLPGARYAHLDSDLSSRVGPQTGRHPLPDPAALGLTAQEKVIRLQLSNYDRDGLGG